ncbi:unnamed protein product, partial [Brassica rapa subsp. narinosa]
MCLGFGLVLIIVMMAASMWRYGIWIDWNIYLNFGKFIKSLIFSYIFSSTVESWEIWTIISEDIPLQIGDSTRLIMIWNSSILLEWKFDIDCVFAPIYTQGI